MSFGPKQRRKLRAQRKATLRVTQARSAIALATASSPLSYGSPTLRQSRMTSDVLKGNTHMPFRDTRMGHKEPRKPDRFTRFDDSLKGHARHDDKIPYSEDVYLEITKPDAKTGTLEVTRLSKTDPKGQELLEKRPIATARNAVDPEILQRWNDKKHVVK